MHFLLVLSSEHPYKTPALLGVLFKFFLLYNLLCVMVRTKSRWTCFFSLIIKTSKRLLASGKDCEHGSFQNLV